MRRLLALLVLVGTAAGVGCWGVPSGTDPLVLRPNGDLVSAGSTVQSEEAVEGDVMLVGNDVEFSGSAGGSFLGAGTTQDVRGRVDGSVRAAGGTVRLAGAVARNVTAVGSDVELESEAVVERNAYLAGGSVVIAGVVQGTLYAGGEEVIIDGMVEGDVRVEASRLTVGPNAHLGGDLRYRVDVDGATIDPGADIDGEVTALPPREERRGGGVALFVFRVLAFVLSAGAVVALFPGTAAETVEVAKTRLAASLGIGLLWGLVAPFGVLVAVVTLVGIPLGLLLAGVYAASIYFAPAVAGIWMGDLVVGRGDGSEHGSPIRSFLVGGPLVAIAILVPWVGPILRLAVGLLGLGAVILALRLRRRGEPEHVDAGGPQLL